MVTLFYLEEGRPCVAAVPPVPGFPAKVWYDDNDIDPVFWPLNYGPPNASRLAFGWAGGN